MTGSRIAACTACTAIAVALFAPACSPEPARDSAMNGNDHTEMATDDPHLSLYIEDVRGVMHAKLAHTQALFEGLVMEDLVQVARNSDELRMLGESAAFRPHKTVAYGIFSDEFAGVAARIAAHARRGDIESAHRDYVILTDTCVKCHDYLRKEHLMIELPGAVSLAR